MIKSVEVEETIVRGDFIIVIVLDDDVVIPRRNNKQNGDEFIELSKIEIHNYIPDITIYANRLDEEWIDITNRVNETEPMRRGYSLIQVLASLIIYLKKQPND